MSESNKDITPFNECFEMSLELRTASVRFSVVSLQGKIADKKGHPYSGRLLYHYHHLPKV